MKTIFSTKTQMCVLQAVPKMISLEIYLLWYGKHSGYHTKLNLS